MKAMRMLFWLVAVVPIAAAGYWSTFAAQLPEPAADRAALGEAAPMWDFAQWCDAGGGPLHVVARTLHYAALQVPGATIASVVWTNVLGALLLLAALAGLTRRAFPATASAAPLAVLVFGLLVGTPAIGVDWLHGERVGFFLAPLSFVAALFWLQRAGGFVWPALLALVVAALAPLCHAHGAAVGLALMPAVLGAARREQRSFGALWAGLLPVFAAAATWFSLRAAPQFGAAGADWLGAATKAPIDALASLARATGGAWLDALPQTDLDELVLGGVSWLAPLWLWRFGDRSDAARAAAAPWWSCLCFGLLLFVVDALRYELAPPVGSLRAATYGAFLLPVGLFGVLAARCGAAVLAFGAGAFTVLGLQDWHQGIEELRLARMRVAGAEVALLLPASAAAMAAPAPLPPAELERLRARGWVRDLAPVPIDAGAMFGLPPSPALGAAVGGAADRVRGRLRSSLRQDTVQWLLVLGRRPDGEAAVIAGGAPEFEGVGRDVPWQVAWPEPLPAGSRLRVVGCLVGARRFVALGPTFVVEAGSLVPTNGP